MNFGTVSRIYPKKLREKFLPNLTYLFPRPDPKQLGAEDTLGFIILASFILSISGAFLLALLYPFFPPYLTWIGFFVLIQVIIFLPVTLKIDANSKEIENVLPDALQIMASNLRAGLTIDQSLLTSARPEFGVFALEMNKIGKEVTTGKDIIIALKESAKRTKSEKYKKTMGLIVSGLRSGGRLADLLTQTSNNLRKQKIVDEKIRSSVMMYVIFIFSAIAFGAPVLFGLSSFLVKVLASVFSNIDIPASAQVASPLPIMSFSEMNISENFVILYTMVSLTVSGIMGGLIMGLISKGKSKEGLKFIPLLVGLSIAIFFIARLIISSLMGDLITL